VTFAIEIAKRKKQGAIDTKSTSTWEKQEDVRVIRELLKQKDKKR
jgi:hypothetical protein